MTAHEAQLLSQEARAAVTAETLLERLDLERLDSAGRLASDPARRAELGQFFTPASVARFMAGMLLVPKPPTELRILDPGGGSGLLTAAAVAEFCGRPKAMRPRSLHATVWEIDELLAEDLARTFDHCHAVCRGAGVAFQSELSMSRGLSRTSFLARSERDSDRAAMGVCP